MELNDLVLVSTDDHVVEPPGMFDGRLPKRLQDGAPRVVDFGNGKFNWIFAGDAAPSLTTSARPGRPVNENNEPTSYADIRPGTYDIHERVKDMDANGVLGSLCFPSFPRFAGQLFANAAKKEPDLSLAGFVPITIGTSRNGSAPTLDDSYRVRWDPSGTRSSWQQKCVECTRKVVRRSASP